jgi:hypothetical protein
VGYTIENGPESARQLSEHRPIKPIKVAANTLVTFINVSPRNSRRFVCLLATLSQASAVIHQARLQVTCLDSYA